MLPNVLAGNVGEIFLVAVALSLQHRAVFLGLLCCAKSTSAEKQAQLERHVEPGQVVDRVALNARNVVNAEPGSLDQAVVNPSSAHIVSSGVQRTV